KINKTVARLTGFTGIAAKNKPGTDPPWCSTRACDIAHDANTCCEVREYCPQSPTQAASSSDALPLSEPLLFHQYIFVEAIVRAQFPDICATACVFPDLVVPEAPGSSLLSFASSMNAEADGKEA
ncbi:unnamed protein product, partial [Amoebophrya sp. A25]